MFMGWAEWISSYNDGVFTFHRKHYQKVYLEDWREWRLAWRLESDLMNESEGGGGRTLLKEFSPWL